MTKLPARMPLADRQAGTWERFLCSSLETMTIPDFTDCFWTPPPFLLPLLCHRVCGSSEVLRSVSPSPGFLVADAVMMFWTCYTDEALEHRHVYIFNFTLFFLVCTKPLFVNINMCIQLWNKVFSELRGTKVHRERSLEGHFQRCVLRSPLSPPSGRVHNAAADSAGGRGGAGLPGSPEHSCPASRESWYQ